MEPYLKTPMRLERGPDVPRAELEDMYWQNGMVDVTRRSVILEQRVMIGRKVAGLVTEPAESIDIDTPLDLALAELRARAAQPRPVDEARWLSAWARSGAATRATGRPGAGPMCGVSPDGSTQPEPLGVPAREFSSWTRRWTNSPTWCW